MDSNDYYIIPDIHHRIKWIPKFLHDYNPNKIIWLGDWNDFWHDTPFDSMKTGLFLAQLMEQRPNDVFILSNHDVSYRFSATDKYKGWGFSDAKCRAFHSQFNPNLWDRFKIFHAEPFRGKKIVYSHAGFLPSFLPNGKFDEDFGRRVEAQAFKLANTSATTSWLDSEFGPIWVRWPKLQVIDDIYQCVGHTPQKRPQIVKGEHTANINLDTNSDYFGYVNDDKFYYINRWTDKMRQLI